MSLLGYVKMNTGDYIPVCTAGTKDELETYGVIVNFPTVDFSGLNTGWYHYLAPNTDTVKSLASQYSISMKNADYYCNAMLVRAKGVIGSSKTSNYFLYAYSSANPTKLYSYEYKDGYSMPTSGKCMIWVSSNQTACFCVEMPSEFNSDGCTCRPIFVYPQNGTGSCQIEVKQSVFETYFALVSEIPKSGTITDITINAPDSVTSGFYVDITADVSGDGDFDTSATCTISGSTVPATVLDDWGDNHWRLFVSASETAESITVTVASVQDPTITASKTITVKQSDDSGGDSGDSGGDGGGDSGGGIIPEGTLEITENGTYDVTEYAEVEVNVLNSETVKMAFWSGFGAAIGMYG